MSRTLRGFTLIELLIVMAVLGVLAAIVLVAIDPGEQLSRGQDAGKKNSIAQLGHALQAYYTTHDRQYVAASASWITTLVNAGELKSAPKNPDPDGCTTTNKQNGFCYETNTDRSEAIVFTQLISKNDKSKCASDKNTWYVYSTLDGRGGVVCTDSGAEPSVASQTFVSS